MLLSVFETCEIVIVRSTYLRTALCERYVTTLLKLPLTSVSLRLRGLYELSEVSGQGPAFTWPQGPDPPPLPVIFMPLLPARTGALWAEPSAPCWVRPFSTLIVALELIGQPQMCLRPRLPQLPPHHKPPQHSSQTQEVPEKKDCRVAGSEIAPRLRASLISLLL